MSWKDDFQDRGDKHRRAQGIDGTAADAQDVLHAYVPDGPDGSLCLVCGLAKLHSKHTRGSH